MSQYIDKNALVAEIERRIKSINSCPFRTAELGSEKLDEGQLNAYNVMLSFIDTLEVKEVDIEQFNKLLNWWKEVTTEHSVYKVKEVDLEKELSMLDRTLFDLDGVAVKGATHYLTVEDVKDIAKHFFELGLKVSNVLTWEDMKQIRDIMVECSAIGLWSKPDEEYYQEVVKRFKAQKGE